MSIKKQFLFFQQATAIAVIGHISRHFPVKCRSVIGDPYMYQFVQ